MAPGAENDAAVAGRVTARSGPALTGGDTLAGTMPSTSTEVLSTWLVPAEMVRFAVGPVRKPLYLHKDRSRTRSEVIRAAATADGGTWRRFIVSCIGRSESVGR